jgi:hypothetical protein
MSQLDLVAHGGGPPVHVHDDEDEVMIVLAGRLAYRIGEMDGSLSGAACRGCRADPTGDRQPVAGRMPARRCAIRGGIEVMFRAQSRYLSSISEGAAADPAAMANLEGADTRRVVRPPLRVPE